MIWLMVAGLLHASQGRHWKGVALLGLAVWLKLLPIVGVGYLLLKRKWQPAVIALLVVAAVDVTLSLAAFGWKGTINEHLMWASAGAAGTVDEQMNGHSVIDEDRITNQSTMVILRRFLTERGGYPQLALADLSPGALSIVTGCVLSRLGWRFSWHLCEAIRPGRKQHWPRKPRWSFYARYGFRPWYGVIT